jgi:hypothetical protein
MEINNIANDLNRFQAIHGAPLRIGSRVTIDPSNEYASEWEGEFLVLGMNWDNRRWVVDICIGEDWKDGGTDGWTVDDLRLAR